MNWLRHGRLSKLRSVGLPLAGAIGLAAASAVLPVHAQVVEPGDFRITEEMQDRFAGWLTSFRSEALQAGIRPATFDRAFRGISLDARVIELDRYQPEFVRPMWEYLGSALSDKRVADGRENLRAREDLFDRLEGKYGVDRHVLAAIWGLETHYGSFMGDRSVIRSLTTLAFEGRRADFARAQLIAALRIIQSGDITPDAMNGSWAGAMGHTQFIPTTYLAHAVDFDGDGKRNVWQSEADALASAANYLAESGWTEGEAALREVKLPDGFDYSLADAGARKTVSEWEHLGVTGVDGDSLPRGERDMEAALVLPAGYRGPAFLTYRNFRTILRYNNATAYGLAVSYLSRLLDGEDGIQSGWPTDERPLTVAEAKEMQEKLTAIGYSTGGVDGIIGPMSRKAIRGFQKRLGEPQDGYPTASLLEKLRVAAGN